MNARALFALLALLTAGVWALGLADVRYRSLETLAFDAGFPGDADAWLRHGEADNIDVDAAGVTIARHVDGGSFAKRLIEFPATRPNQDRMLRIELEVDTLATPTNETIEDRRARVMLFLLDDPEAEPVRYRTVQALFGDRPTLTSERVLHLQENERSTYLVLMNEDSDGSFRLVDASLDLVDSDPRWYVGAVVLGCGWALAALWLAAWLLHRLGVVRSALLTIPLAAITAGVLLPEDLSLPFTLPIADRLLDALRTGVDQASSAGLPSLFKLGHFLFFLIASIAAFALRARLGLSVIGLFAAFVVFALATEGLQLHLAERTTRWSDLAIDLGGVALGAALVLIVARVVGRRTNDPSVDAVAGPPPEATG